MDFRIKGVPLYNFTFVIKNMVIEQSRDTYMIKSKTIQPKSSIGKCFYNNECIDVMTIPNTKKCIARWSNETVFVSDTIFKGTILKSSKENSLSFQKLWWREAKRRKLIPDELLKLNHDVESADSIEAFLNKKPSIRSTIEDVFDTICFSTGELIHEKKWRIDKKSVIIFCLSLVILILMNFLSHTEARIDVLLSKLESSLPK